MVGKPLYSARDVLFSYGVGQPAALSIPFLDIGEGECLMLLGPNGSGKTTFLKMLNDLLPAGAGAGVFAGELVFRGDPVFKGPARLHPRSVRTDTVYMHQHPYVLSGSVARNLSFACRARGLSAPEAARASAEALELVGLEGYSARRQKGLSGGEAQRLALARVIASGAGILLLDEPTASADAASRDRIIDALASLADRGKTVIFSTHETKTMDRLGRRVLEFERGTIIGDTRRRHADEHSS